jgi:hypothetical protein
MSVRISASYSAVPDAISRQRAVPDAPGSIRSKQRSGSRRPGCSYHTSFSVGAAPAPPVARRSR